MELLLTPNTDKKIVFTAVNRYLGELSLGVASVDDARPWGGFFVIDEGDTDHFIDTYFPDLPREQIAQYGNKLSPKILVVEADKRLSWQYHHRRAELWRVVQGPVGVITSETNEQGPVRRLEVGETVQFDAQVRHRLLGLDGWGVVAEIWQHTEPTEPSDESDIVRVEDDFGR